MKRTTKQTTKTTKTTRRCENCGSTDVEYDGHCYTCGQWSPC